MMNNKLIQVLKTFSKEEFKNFLRYMNSPYFNRYKPDLRLVEELKSFHEDFDNPKFTQEYIFEKIYPGKRYNDSTMTNIMCDVLLRAEDFLAMEKFRCDNHRNDLYLLKSLSERGLENVYRRNMKRIKSELSRDGELDADYFYMLHELESNLADFKITHDSVVHKDSIPPRIAAMEQSYLWLMLSYFIKLIECLHKIWLYGEKFNMDFENELIKDMISTLDIPKLEQLIRSGTKFGYIIELYLSLAKIFCDTRDRNKYLGTSVS